MQWLVDLFRGDSIAHSILILGLVAAAGLALGSIRLFKINLGVAGVLFAGLAFGHYGLSINHEVMDFAREFGLILFVYSIGIQVGPGFLGSLRREGLPLNLMAATIVLLGVGLTVAIALTRFEPHERVAAIGLYSGATTNTPSLGAARQALKDAKGLDPSAGDQAVLSYAMAYPFGIIGIIAAMLLTRVIFRIDTRREEQLLASRDESRLTLQTINLELRNANLEGIQLKEIPTLGQSGVVISRVLQGGRPQVARGDLVLHLGDVLLAVGPREGLDDLRLIVGAESQVDVRSQPGNLTTRQVLVTRSAALGKSIRELDPMRRFGVIVTRIHRAEVELPAKPETTLQFADSLLVVGEPGAIAQFASEVGDSPKRLNHPQIIPVFLGIALGVILGSWPLTLPGMPAPVRLGLAGGPLLVAIILSRLGHIGPLVWHMPIPANFVVREAGIALFLACVGLNSGGQFIETLRGDGLEWMAYGAIITLLPLLVVALGVRFIYRTNYLSLCGLLAGSMTDPPALAFAGAMTGSEAPSISYATVYPLVMLLRVLSAQALVLFLL